MGMQFISKRLASSAGIGSIAQRGLALAVLGAAAGLPATAMAGATATAAVVSDYDWRGITQSSLDPAFQLGIDYRHSSGLYAGVWGSTVDWSFFPGDNIEPDLEADFYAGYAGGDAAGTFGYDLGVTYYTYPGLPGPSADYWEVNAGLSKGWFSAKLWYAPEFQGQDYNMWYAETNATIPLAHGFTLTGHVGYNFGSFFEALPPKDYAYFDFSVGVAKSWKYATVALKYIDGSDYDFDYAFYGAETDVFSSKAKLWASISTTFPWSRN